MIGGSTGIGLETARQARAEGAEVILTARDPSRLERAATELGAKGSVAFDATDFDRLDKFFEELPAPIDHLMVTAGGPYYGPLKTMDFDQARRDVEQHLWLTHRPSPDTSAMPRTIATMSAYDRSGSVWPRPGR